MRWRSSAVAVVLTVGMIAAVGVAGLSSQCIDEGPCTGYKYIDTYEDFYWEWHHCYPIDWECVTLYNPLYDDCRETCRWNVYENPLDEYDICWDLFFNVTVCYR
ncbi:hypothetical protein JW848_06760 [Candidatus Bipolaricaulota bacterium]|nr:hypothetical protein [Candidatus Bipolaricaulota bacterium]